MVGANTSIVLNLIKLGIRLSLSRVKLVSNVTK